MELENYPGMKADVYISSYDDTDWYIKLFVEDGEMHVHI